MARYLGPRGRRDRRAGVMLSSMRKNPLERKPYPPGEHGRGRQRQTEYGVRLLEKQKARWYYGVSEKQFARAYERATRMQGVTGENLLRLMELRMDNVVYRMGFATSRPQARQLVGHGHFQLNGRKHDIPSAVLKAGGRPYGAGEVSEAGADQRGCRAGGGGPRRGWRPITRTLPGGSFTRRAGTR